MMEPSQADHFGELFAAADQACTDGYDKISVIEDDRCLEFIIEPNGRNLNHIPMELVNSIVRHKGLHA